MKENSKDNSKNLIKRPPIVVVMGHVDHGKTTFLDYVRKTNVAGKEAGGITQAVGAYEIEVHHPDEPKSRENETKRGIPRQEPRAFGSEAQARRDDFANRGRKITFIDTPGHEAFSKMRRRGAKIADIAILVVAGDEGVKSQTKDALQHILDEKIPYVIAINKIDKPGFNEEKTKNELMQAGVYLEGFGGNVSYSSISAKTGKGVDELLDLVLLASEVENLIYDEDAPASGFILTARLDKRRGLEAGVILQNGVLKFGDVIHTETAAAKIKILEDFSGKAVKSLMPSAPALVFGWEKLPEIGEEFFETNKKIGEVELKNNKIDNRAIDGEDKEKAKLILKADEAGSLEALSDLAERIGADYPLIIVAKSLGHIYENDVKLAQNTNAIILAFNAPVDKAAENMIRNQNVILMESKIIYKLEEMIREYLKKMKAIDARIIEILAIFGGKKGKEQVVGGKVLVGPIKNQESFEVWSENKLVGAGRIINMQSGRKDLAEVVAGSETGLLVLCDISIKIGNQLRFI